MKLLQVASYICLVLSTATTISNASLLVSDNNVEEEQEVVSSSKLLRRRRQQQIIGGSSSSICKSIIAVGGTKRIDPNNPPPHPTNRTLQQVHSYPYRSEYDHYETDEEFVCEMLSGKTVPLQGTTEQLSEMRALLNRGDLISSESTVEIDSIRSIGSSISSMINNGIAGMTNDSDSGGESMIATLPSGSIKVINDNIDNEEDRRTRRLRRLNMYEGTKKTLVIRVTDSANRQPNGNAKWLSDKFFGTDKDPFTMSDGFKDCTFGKLIFTPYYNNQSIESKLSAPGVLDVRINAQLTQITQSTMRELVMNEARRKLGFTLPGNVFDHVLIVVEHCYPNSEDTCSFAAYAFVNHWQSVYVDRNYEYPAVTIHELGHNLNLAHSGGLDGRTYTDHSCLMGNPWWEDNMGRMCFNPVKNYQIMTSGNSWYDINHAVTWNSGTTVYKQWSGRIIGVAQYDKNTANHPIVVKLETGTEQDWFIGFNHAVGNNVDVKEAINEVSIYKVDGGNGNSYSHSFLKGYLQSGKDATITDWRNTGKSLVIKVDSINLNAVPAYADVTITFWPEGKPAPTRQPTRQPSRNPTRQPTAQPTVKPTLKPTAQPTAKPTNQPSNKPSNQPTNQASKKPSKPTSQPSNQPSTRKPTPLPTPKPSVNPTVKPTSAPVVVQECSWFARLVGMC